MTPFFWDMTLHPLEEESIVPSKHQELDTQRCSVIYQNYTMVKTS
jgi:hypothetical protein